MDGSCDREMLLQWNPRYNDVPAKVTVKCMGQNPDITIFDITMSFKCTERKIFPDITILQHQDTDTTSNV